MLRATSVPRSILRGLTVRAATNPIEVVVAVFCAVTLAYFKLLHNLTHSSFLDTLELDIATTYSHRLRAGATAGVKSAAVYTTAATRAWSRNSSSADASWQLLSSLPAAEDTATKPLVYVRPLVVVDAERGAQGSGARKGDKLFQAVVQALEKSTEAVPLPEASGGKHALVALAKTFEGPEAVAEERELLHKLSEADYLETVFAIAVAAKGVKLPRSQRWELSPVFSEQAFVAADRAVPSVAHSQHPTEQIKSFRWVAYASRALVHKFLALLRKADSADIFVMLSVYIFMHATFVNLFLSMRKFGSNFWLGASVLTSGTFAFLVALTMSYYCGVTVDPVSLSEALPFLVVIVGFEKPYLLTRAVFTHPAFAPPMTSPTGAQQNLLLDALNETEPASQDGSAPANGSISREESFVRALTARLKEESASLRWEMPQPLPAKDIILAAADSQGPRIVKDYLIEIAVLLVGATSGLSGLREFCQLAALILIFDCIFLFTFYSGILTVMVEVHRIKVLRGTRRAQPPTPPNNDTDEPVQSGGSATPTSRSGSPERPPRSAWQLACKVLFGYVPFDRSGRENPAARLKLMLLASFLILHSLNLVSTLTTQSAFSRHQSTRVYTPFEAFVESTGPLSWSPDDVMLAPLAGKLAATHGNDLTLQISEPVFIALVDASSTHAQRSLGAVALDISASNRSLASRSLFQAQTRSTSSFDVLDSLVIGWSSIVGDPVISKWMSIALAISIFLNAYLLKGIATGNTAVAQGNAAGAAAFAAARMLGAHLNSEGDVVRKRFDDRTPRSKSKGGEVDKYHKQLANISAQHASSQLQKLPGIDTDGELTKNTDDAVTNDRRLTLKPDANGRLILPASDDGKGTATKPHVNGTAATRPFEEIVELYAGGAGVFFLSDEELILLAQKGKIAGHALEKLLQDHDRAVRIRRALVSRASFSKTLETSLLPHLNYNYGQVMGACCENVVGYMPLPVGIAGPLNIDGQLVPIPMATTEGTLVASTSRGCKALNAGGGVTTVLTQDAMTRGPALEFPSVVQAAKAKRWIDSQEGASAIKAAFDSTSRFARLSSLRCVLAGRTLFVRFATATGDAMGMNMISKGVEKALAMMTESHFPDMRVLSLSGNYCTDKKPAAINWIEGRGKSVVAEAIVPGSVVRTVLKTTVPDLVNLNTKKNLIGSAMAGSVGGFNAHAANILTAVFLATGQDPAQNVESSNCMTLMEPINDGEDLLLTVSMPSIEVGTVGGGTVLSPQRSMLEMIGVAGAHPTTPGANAQRLARIIAASVMAGELSLLSALAAGHLIQAHMKHNRSQPSTPGTMTPNRPETPRNFAAQMTPLVAMSVGTTAPQSRDSPSASETSSLKVEHSRRATHG